MFGHRSNISLVFDFMDTDLEMIIKEPKIVLTPGNIKAYTIMTLQGLEYLHAQFILHRVSQKLKYYFLRHVYFLYVFVTSKIKYPNFHF